MSSYQFVVRAENRVRFEHLREMRQLLRQYYDALSQLVELYSYVWCTVGSETIRYSWQVPLSAFVNFRDALFHYSAACKREEVIELIEERSKLEEHLHRAVKDTAVFFLQRLGNKLESLWSYSRRDNSTAGSSPVKVDPESIKEKFYSLRAAGECEDALVFLHASYADVLRSNKSVLQHWMHEIRNYDLETRDSSMQIQKPFHPDSLHKFLNTIDECNEKLKANDLFELVYWFADFIEVEVVP